MITAQEVTNYYLYGSSNKPATIDTALMIRPVDETSTVSINTVEYMSTGPGRFANPVLFEVIDKFFNPTGTDASSMLQAGSYQKADLFSAFGIVSGGLVLQQWLYDDGLDDMVERAYIWNTTQFQIDPRARFIVDQNGNRSIENFAIIPRVKDGSPENFDFKAGDGVGKLANLALEPAIDPSGIGRTVILSFSDDQIPVKNFSQSDYNTSVSNLVIRNELNVVKLISEFPSFVTNLWNEGTTNTVDADGRVILYGTAGSDVLSEARIDALTIVDPMARYYIESGKKGLVLIGGGGNDKLVGTDMNDYIVGGNDSDTLIGGAGLDILVGGKGNDVLHGELGGSVLNGGEGEDTYYISSRNYGHTIIDSDSLGSIIDDGYVLHGGKRYDGSYYLFGDDYGNQYGIYGPDLVINGSTIVKNWKNGDFGIHLDPRASEIGWLDGENSMYKPGVLAMLARLDGAPWVGNRPTGDDDFLFSDGVSTTLNGGRGNDVLYGSEFADTYVYNQGDGDDWIQEYGSNGTGFDTLKLGAGITPSSITFSRSESDLVMSMGEGKITFINGGVGSQFRPARVEFADGTVWDARALSDKFSQLPPLVVIIPDPRDETVLPSGAGDDELNGTGGSDTYLFERGGGHDSLANFGRSYNGVDAIIFGAGITASDIIFSRSKDGVVLTISGSGESVTINNWNSLCKIRAEFADGSAWDVPTVRGKVAAVPFVGTDGNDVLEGGQDNDVFIGGKGDDQLIGSSGSDTYVFGRSDGKDSISDDGTGSDVDTIRFGAGVSATDVVLARSGSSVVLTIIDTGDSISISNWNNESIERVEFSDGTVWDHSLLMAKIGLLPYVGTDGDDILNGDDGANVFNGGKGDDLLTGSTGSDIYLFGRGDGRDTIKEFGFSSDDIDTIQFGASITANDIAVFRSGNNITLSIFGTDDSITINNWNVGSYYQIEQTKFADGTVWDVATLMAKFGTAPFTGSNGDDWLDGDKGANLITGKKGNDNLSGWAGSDTYLFDRGDGRDTIHEFGYSDDDVDTIRFGSNISAADITLSRSGNDVVLTIADSDDTITISNWNGGSSYRIERVEFADATVWDASVLMAKVALLPFAGTDADDWINGDKGANVFIGGKGDDHLSGSTGSDIYVFGRGDGNDTITEFDYSSGDIDIIRFGPNIEASDVTLSRSGGDVVLAVEGTDDSVTVEYWSSDSRIERVEFADGTAWDAATLLAKVAELPLMENDSEHSLVAEGVSWDIGELYPAVIVGVVSNQAAVYG
ncbi:hypothetical protein O0881_04550 [Janthinobacterium sp. SUN100]|uniref:calcium-binding protein n=1 Tax=Janthinobacterium sp. SUN100 TaxID=3004101 RepID=UPI0025B115B4|nr:calcium-binding protein [Janthinobacterium sp. SUN100]MDN2701266.1 hypothetical protein [Janthinobacterium sp. SUN100]